MERRIKKTKFLGNIISIYEGQTNIKELISKRGGGDIVTTLLVYSLEKRIIDKALVVKMSEKEPWKAIPFIAKTKKEIISASGSKYTFVPNYHLLEQLDEKSAIVGLPCQINTCVNKKIFKLGIFCGLNFSPMILEYLFKKMKVEKKDIESLDYRSPTTKAFTVKLKNGEKKSIAGYSSLAYFFLQKKCLFCKDYSNHFADISVGDRRPGWSVIIVRTEKGRDIFSKALRNGYIKAKKINKEDFLKKRMTPLMQKEKRGGFINSRFVRPRGKWIESVPFPILKHLGDKIGKLIR